MRRYMICKVKNNFGLVSECVNLVHGIWASKGIVWQGRLIEGEEVVAVHMDGVAIEKNGETPPQIFLDKAESDYILK
jgi:hypothetical protein